MDVVVSQDVLVDVDLAHAGFDEPSGEAVWETGDAVEGNEYVAG